MNTKLLNEIRQATAAYPMHMPGHKRNPLFMPPLSCAEDLTETDTFDDLHNPKGVLRDCLNFAAELYGTRRSFFLVNGSTGGILSAMYAACPRGKKILLARNCHMSAYNAAEQVDLEFVLVEPQWNAEYGVYGGLSPETLDNALKIQPDIALAVVVSPAYEGMTSDISALAGICHAHHIPLLADEAHGAHLPFSRFFPDSATDCGADIVVQSLHKTLPAPTQCAVLHLCSEEFVAADELARSIGIFETSSPSYIFVCAMDRCLRLMADKGEALLETHAQRLRRFYRETQELVSIKVMPCVIEGAFARDQSKLWISTFNAGMSGEALWHELNRRGFALEMHTPHGALALTTLCDTDEAMERFARTLRELDAEISLRQASALRETAQTHILHPPLIELVMSPAKARAANGETLLLAQTVGRISRETIFASPPCVPIILPGQRISDEAVNAVRTASYSLCGERIVSVVN